MDENTSTMSSVFRFNLLNLCLEEPVDINPCLCQSFPTIKRMILFPVKKKQETLAFVEIENAGEEQTLHEIAQGFMDWVSWLLSLAELHDVYYWGAHHFKKSTAWKLQSSSWRLTYVRNWRPTASNIFDVIVQYWRLPKFLSEGLKKFSDMTFSRQEFIRALHMFSDSLWSTDQLPEVQFIKKWTALESLINEDGNARGYMYIFGKQNAPEFVKLRREIANVIKKQGDRGDRGWLFLREFIDSAKRLLHITTKPSLDENNKGFLLRMLSALERMPIKIMARTFLDKLSITYDGSKIDEIVDTRNGILHRLEKEIKGEEVWKLDELLKGLLSEVLCAKLGWNLKKELQERYVTPCSQPLPDYVELQDELTPEACYGSGKLESEGKTILKCDGTITWSRDGVIGQFTSNDPSCIVSLLNLQNNSRRAQIWLSTNDGRKVSVSRAKVSHLDSGSRSFHIYGSEVFVEYP
jgi:hypothetical protein